MKSINEILKESQDNNERIIEVNSFFVLSQSQKKLHIRGSNDNQISFETTSYFKINRVSERFLEIKWDTRNITERHLYPSLDLSKENTLYFDFENESFFYCESESKCILFNKIKRITKYDFNLEKIDLFLGWASYSKKEASIKVNRILVLDDDDNYDLYSDDELNYVINIICHHENTITIVSIINGSSKIVQTFNKIKKYKRLTRIEGYNTLLFDYFIIETEQSSILLNLKTLKHFELSFKTIIPATFEFRSNYYLHKHRAKDIINIYRQYVCVDNKIFDENFNVVMELKSNLNGNIALLDNIGDCIAVFEKYKDFNSFSFFHVKEHVRNNNFVLQCKKGTYSCCQINSSSKIVLRIHGLNWNIFFDPNALKFIVDVKKIQEEDRIRRQNEDDYTDHDYNKDEDTWYALTDGMYGDYPGGNVDYDIFGF